MNEKVDVEIAGRRLMVEMEDLTPFEINAIANQVNEKFTEVQGAYTKVADTAKLAIYTALYLGADLYKLKQADSTNHKAIENTLDHIGKTLEQTLTAIGTQTTVESE